MTTSKKTRVRFAPSPTGNLHIGGMRTALFNWLFARHNDGDFLIRVEDTDQQRSKKEYVDAQVAALNWCGIKSDQELIFQSARTDAYQAILKNFSMKKSCTDAFVHQKKLKRASERPATKMNILGMTVFVETK